MTCLSVGVNGALSFSLVCLVGFLAFAAKSRFDTALRASGDYIALSHMILLSVFSSLQESFNIRLGKEKCTFTCFRFFYRSP